MYVFDICNLNLLNLHYTPNRNIKIYMQEQ